ncbi:MAG: homoserine O-succinyltransferase [Clostridia bacterium]|nr:homoserine O-succinyltransferase [Clostridia bacterium]MBR4459637.1 homoserine O-succinyltransferase [Clostridia bacterium]
MPIRINTKMPVIHRLAAENIFVITEKRAATQDIRELQIAILNIMPNKEDTELQLLRLLSNTPLQVRVTFLRLDSHQYKNTPEEYLSQFYKPFSSVKERRFDGLIITGAPVENLPFEQVDYWQELTEIMDWSTTHVTSTVHICWAAQAGLFYHYGIEKHPLPEKLSGIYRHTTLYRDEILTRGFNDRFFAPHSRYTGVDTADVAANQDLTILAEADEAGVYLIEDKKAHRVFVCGHPEYSRMTLDNEYRRDLSKGLNPKLPVHYYRDDDPAKDPVFQWKAHAYLLFSNWLNYSVYQVTPYELNEIGGGKE